MWTANALHMGHPVVLMDKWTPEGMLELIDQHNVTTSHMVPTQFHRLLALPEDVRGQYDVSSLRCMVHAAAPCPPEIKRRMIEWWGDAIMEYYAATEGGGTIVTAQEWLTKPGTVGKAWPGSEIRILDDDDKQLPTGTEGTVYMSLVTGQLRVQGRPEEDRGEPHRRLLHRRRLGPARRGRLPVPQGPQVRHDHLGRREHLPGRDRGHAADLPEDRRRRPCSASPTRTGARRSRPSSSRPRGSTADDALRDEILEFCRENLASYKRPKSIDFMAELPRDPNGKLYKRKLRDPYWADRDRRI